jgi:5-(carboxyamino)imidazole ribonucleotide synthase
MRLGIIGGGQLGQMLGIAARELGHECLFLDPSAEPPARMVGPVIQATFDDVAALAILAEKCDVLTYEFENVPVGALEGIADLAPIHPPLGALSQAQDRLAEKRLFEDLGIPLPGFYAVDSGADLEAAVARLGLPVVLKTRRLGYDGKGQYVVRNAREIPAAVDALGGRDLIAEEWIDFDYEVSAIGVRNTGGEIVTYCLTQNEHEGGILWRSRAPVPQAGLARTANDYLGRMLDHLDYVGVLALELFVVGDALLANEFAPRVHNSGHWTIEGAETSQFANHVRAITGAAPGPTANRDFAGMLNLIGTIPDAVRDAVRRCPQAVLHDYGKAPRPGRKLGHITITAETDAARDRLLADIGESVTGSSGATGRPA